MANFNKNTLDNFKDYTGYDIESYLSNYIDFIDNHSQNIISYYSGNIQSLNRQSFANLYSLIEQSKIINNLIEQNKKYLSGVDYWELLEFLERIVIKLKTFENTPKWLRSTITKNNFNPSTEITHTLSQFESIEKASVEFYNKTDFDWVVMAIRNNIREEDYTLDGGLKIKSSFANNSLIQVDTVVDTINEENIYGKDINKKIKFDADNQDFLILSADDTFFQMLDINLNLKKGDNPHFRNDGINSSSLSSSSSNISYAIIFKDIYATLSKEDTISSIKITNIVKKDTAIFIEIEILGVRGDVFSFNTELT